MMNNALKGALLSGLVFPGLGQVMLKYYKRGAVLMIAITATLLAVLIKAVQQAFTILEKIELEGGEIDMSTILSTATQASTTSDSLIFKLLLWLVIFCWVIGVVDAYRIGRKKDIEGRLANKASNGNDR
jgi:hypothetical protein